MSISTLSENKMHLLNISRDKNLEEIALSFSSPFDKKINNQGPVVQNSLRHQLVKLIPTT